MTETLDGTSEPQRDDIARAMDSWQSGCALRLQMDYGHDFSRAWMLAGMSRSMLEADLRKPRPLLLITGV